MIDKVFERSDGEDDAPAQARRRDFASADELVRERARDAQSLMVRYAERLRTQLGYQFVDHHAIVDHDTGGPKTT